MTGDGRGGAGTLADSGSLRRIELVAVAWTAAGALAYGLVRSWSGGLVLTGVAAVAIVLFRGLQRIVSTLGPGGSGPAEPPEGGGPLPAEPAPTEPRPPRDRGAIGWRTALGAIVRLALLGAVAVAGSLLLEPEYFPAIVLGFSTLPAALMTEGLLQGLRALQRIGRGEDHDDVA